MMSVSRTARRSPIPTQLNGRTIVYGSWYCSQAPLAKYSDGELLEAVGRDRRRRRQLGALGRRKDGRGLVDHRAADDDDPLEAPRLAGRDRRVERRGKDPLVLGDQVVGELVEVADAADHRRGRDDLVDIGRQLGHQRDVLGVALDEPVARMVVVRLGQAAVLAEVVEPDDLVAGVEQLVDEVAVDEPGAPVTRTFTRILAGRRAIEQASGRPEHPPGRRKCQVLRGSAVGAAGRPALRRIRHEPRDQALA